MLWSDIFTVPAEPQQAKHEVTDITDAQTSIVVCFTAESHLQIAISDRCACITIPLIKVKVIQADGTHRDSQSFKSPPKTAREILERLQASGFVGKLQDAAGVSLTCSDLLGDSQQYTLKLAPSGDLHPLVLVSAA